MKFSELQRLQRMEGITVLSADKRIEQLEARLRTITKERDALRAKIEAMGRQEQSEQDASVRKAWSRFSNELHRNPDASYPGMSEAFEQHFSQSFTDREWRAESATWAAAWKAAKRHGAQPAPSVPELLESLRCACNYIDKLGGVSQQYRAMIAATPKAKP